MEAVVKRIDKRTRIMGGQQRFPVRECNRLLDIPVDKAAPAFISKEQACLEVPIPKSVACRIQGESKTLFTSP